MQRSQGIGFSVGSIYQMLDVHESLRLCLHTFLNRLLSVWTPGVAPNGTAEIIRSGHRWYGVSARRMLMRFEDFLI